MTRQPNLRIAVENFGPIRRGQFELKPLTVFIGPNNSGKSYLALLLYALYQGLVGETRGRFRRYGILRSRIPEELTEVGRWLGSWSPHQHDMVIGELPASVKIAVQKGIKALYAIHEQSVDAALRGYFGIESMHELVNISQSRGSLSVHVDSTVDAKLLNLRVRGGNKNCDVEWGEVVPESLPVARDLAWSAALPEDLFAEALIHDIWIDGLRSKGMPERDMFYLPSARSGILQGWPVYASMALQAVRLRAEAIEVAPFRGVTGDFLTVLYERLFALPLRSPDHLQPPLDILEGRSLQGQVSIAKASAERPVMEYRSGNVRLPLHRASSMVAELAPLDLWIKYVLDPGDLLVIDEPEAHLHPENQRNIARVLVRLARAGVQVVCPTHSSLILHQISNHLLASKADAATRAKLGFTEDDLISMDDVGVYLFEMHEDGTYVKEIALDPDLGIPEDEFLRVSESIGEETYRLSLASRTLADD